MGNILQAMAIMFFEKQKELNMLPIRLKFVHNALTVFYKIVNKLLDVSMPEYIHKVHPQVLRFTRTNANTIHCRDTSSYSCAILPNCNAFRNSFFYRTMLLWNVLPIDIRNIDKISSFKRELTKYMWTAGNIGPIKVISSEMIPVTLLLTAVICMYK